MFIVIFGRSSPSGPVHWLPLQEYSPNTPTVRKMTLKAPGIGKIRGETEKREKALEANRPAMVSSVKL